MMKSSCFFCCLLMVVVHGVPVHINNTNDYIQLSTLLYTANHDVVSLGVLLDESINDKVVFFIEADNNAKGERIDFGLYSLKNGSITKLLNNARDIAVANLSEAYFAANDGIYYYNKLMNSVEKYGSINDDVISISITVENSTVILYYLNKEHQLYKVTENGKKCNIIDAVKDAQEIVTDHTGHLYYYSADKSFYMYDGNDVTTVEGMSSDLKKVRFIKTPLVVEDRVVIHGDGRYYLIFSNNSTVVPVEHSDQINFEVSALSMDSGLVMYFAKDKKIYEFNIIEKIVEGILEALSEKFKNMVQQFKNAINSLKI